MFYFVRSITDFGKVCVGVTYKWGYRKDRLTKRSSFHQISVVSALAMLITQASIARAQQAGDFNLGSPSKSGTNLLSSGQTATIKVAGANKIVQSGTLLTAAEQVALSQEPELCLRLLSKSR